MSSAISKRASQFAGGIVGLLLVAGIMVLYSSKSSQQTTSSIPKNLGAETRQVHHTAVKASRLTRAMVEEFKAMVTRREFTCADSDMYGNTQKKMIEGAWPICRAPDFLPTQPCIVYSFGVNYNWLFEDAHRAHHNCTVRTFDPSMGETKEHVHIPGVLFYPMGLSGNKTQTDKGWKMDTYIGFLNRFNERDKIISYLKFDIEHYEWSVLANMLSSEVLDNVMQLSFELHVRSWAHVRKYTALLQSLRDRGFRRWFYKKHVYHKYKRYIYQADQSYLNINFVRNV